MSTFDSTSIAPTAPSPCITFSTPGGSFASCASLPISAPTKGVSSEGL